MGTSQPACAGHMGPSPLLLRCFPLTPRLSSAQGPPRGR